MILPPENFRYDDETQKLIWDAVPDADEYQIRFKPVLSPLWEIIYAGGNETSCCFEFEPGTYNVDGKTESGTEWSVFSPDYIIVVV